MNAEGAAVVSVAPQVAFAGERTFSWRWTESMLASAAGVAVITLPRAFLAALARSEAYRFFKWLSTPGAGVRAERRTRTPRSLDITSGQPGLRGKIGSILAYAVASTSATMDAIHASQPFDCHDGLVACRSRRQRCNRDGEGGRGSLEGRRRAFFAVIVACGCDGPPPPRKSTTSVMGRRRRNALLALCLQLKEVTQSGLCECVVHPGACVCLRA